MPNRRWRACEAANRRKRKKKQAEIKGKKTGTKKETAAAEELKKREESTCTEEKNGTKENKSHSKNEETRNSSDNSEIPSFTTDCFSSAGEMADSSKTWSLPIFKWGSMWQLYMMKTYSLEKWCYQLCQLMWPSSTCILMEPTGSVGLQRRTFWKLNGVTSSSNYSPSSPQVRVTGEWTMKTL